MAFRIVNEVSDEALEAPIGPLHEALTRRALVVRRSVSKVEEARTAVVPHAEKGTPRRVMLVVVVAISREAAEQSACNGVAAPGARAGARARLGTMLLARAGGVATVLGGTGHAAWADVQTVCEEAHCRVNGGNAQLLIV